MDGIVSILEALVVVMFNALVAYDMTEEGHAELENLLAEVEKEGYDIPFWEPDQPDLDISSPDINVREAVDDLAKRWLSRHPAGESK